MLQIYPEKKKKKNILFQGLTGNPPTKKNAGLTAFDPCSSSLGHQLCQATQAADGLLVMGCQSKGGYFFSHTPPKINIESENDGLEDVSPFPGVYSQVPC